MKNFTSRLLTAFIALSMIVVAACTSNDDEGIIPTTSTQEMIDLSTALGGDAQIVSATSETTANGSFIVELDNGAEYYFPYEENNVYTVSNSGIWQLNATNVSGSPYYSTLRAQTASDAAPMVDAKATDPELDGKTLYWVAGKNSKGSWLWNPYYTDSGKFYSNTILYLTDTPDLIYNGQTNSLTLVVNGSVEVYETEITGGGDVSVDGDTVRTLASANFDWNYDSAVDGNYTFNVNVMTDGPLGLLSTQREAIASTSKEPTITITDADSGEVVNPKEYNFTVDESSAAGYTDPHIVMTTTNPLSEARNLYVKLTYEKLADDGIANLVVTAPIIISGAPTATFGYIKSTDYTEGMEDYWSVTNELYSDIYYGCTWSENYNPSMFGIVDGMADKYAMAKLEAPVAGLEFAESYSYSIEGVNEGAALATLTKSGNSFGINLEKDYIKDYLLDLQMDFSPEDKAKFVTLTDPNSGFKLEINPAFFTVNDGERISMRNTGATFEWNYFNSYQYAMNLNTVNPYETAFMKLTVDGEYTDIADQMKNYISTDGYKSSLSLGEASTGSTVGLNSYKASDFSCDLDVDKNKGICYVRFIGKSIMAKAASFSIIVTLPEAYTPADSEEKKNIVITVPVTIDGAPKLYATRTQGPTQVLLGNMVYTTYGVPKETLSTSNDGMIAGIYGMSKYDLTDTKDAANSGYKDALYPTTAAPEGYDSVNDIWKKFDLTDRTKAESIIEASVRGASYISPYNPTLANETYQGMDDLDLGFVDLNTPVRLWQRDNAFGYGYGYDIKRLEDFVKTSDFFTGIASNTFTTIQCPDVYELTSYHPTGFSYTMSGYVRLALRMFYYMSAETSRFKSGYATVADDGVLDGIYGFKSATAAGNAAQLDDLVVRYEILNAPTDGSAYPIITVDENNQSILNMKGRTDLTKLDMAAYMTLPIDYSDVELRFYDGASAANKGYAYQTFSLKIEDGFAGVAVHTKATAESATGFKWNYTDALAKLYTVNDYVIDGVSAEEFARISAAAKPDLVEVTAGTFEIEDIAFKLSEGVEGDKLAAITLSNSTLSTAQDLAVTATYEGLADNGENVIINYTIAITGAPSVVVDAMVADETESSDGMVDYTQLGTMPWKWVFGAIKSQLETATWSNGAYEDMSEIIDTVIPNLAITDGDERLIITEDKEMAINIESNDDYTERSPISYTDVVLEDESGFKVTYSGLSLTLFNPANTFVALDSSVAYPKLTWDFTTSNVFEAGTVDTSNTEKRVYTGEGYKLEKLLLGAEMTSELYAKISGVTPTISFSGSDAYAGAVEATLSTDNDKYYIDLHFQSTLAETVAGLKVYATYDADDAKVIIEVPVNVQGAPRLIGGTRIPSFWFDGASSGNAIGGNNSYKNIFSSNLNVTSTTNAAGETIPADGWNTVYTRFNSVNGTAVYGGTDAQSLLVTSMRDAIYYKSNPSADGHLYLEYLYGNDDWSFNYRIDSDKLQEIIDGHDYYANYPSFAEYPSTKDVASTASITDMKIVHASGYSVYYQFYCVGFNFAMEMKDDATRISGDVANVEEDTAEANYGVLDGIFTTNLFDAAGTAAASTIVVYEIDTNSENYSNTNYPTIELDREGNSVVNWNGYTGSEVDMIAYLAMPITGDDFTSGTTKQLVFYRGASDENKKYAYREFKLQVSNDFSGVVMPSYGAASSGESSERFTWDYESATAATPSYTVDNFAILGDIKTTEYARIQGTEGTIEVTSTETIGEDLVPNFNAENISVDLLADQFANVTLSGDNLAKSKTINFDLTYSGAADNGSDVVIEFTIAVDGAPEYSVAESSPRIALETVADPYKVAVATLTDALTDLEIDTEDKTSVVTAMTISYTDEDENAADYTFENVDGVLTLTYPNTPEPLTKSFSNVVLTDPNSGISITYTSINFEIFTAGTVAVDAANAEMMWMYETAASIVAGENNDAKYSSAALALDEEFTEAFYTAITADGAEIVPTITLSGDLAESYSVDDIKVLLSETDGVYNATLMIYDKMAVGGALTVKATYEDVDEDGTTVEISIPVTITGAPVFGKNTAISWSSEWTEFKGVASKAFAKNLVENSTAGKINATATWKGGAYKQFGVSEEKANEGTFYRISDDGSNENSQIYAAMSDLHANYETLPVSNKGYFTVANDFSDPADVQTFGIRIDLNEEAISEALLAMNYDTTTKKYPFKQISNETTQENFGDWIRAEFTKNDNYYVMNHPTGFSVQVGYNADNAKIFGIGLNDLNFNASLAENEIYFTEAGVASIVVSEKSADLNDIYTISNAGSTTSEPVLISSILFEVTDDSGVTVEDGILNMGEYTGTEIAMSATLQMTSTEGNSKVFSIHKYPFTLKTMAATTNKAEFTWNYAKSYASYSYTAEVEIFNEDIALGSNLTVSLQGADVENFTTTENVNVTVAEVEGTRVATVTISNYNMATSVTSLNIVATDNDGNNIAIPVTVVGAPTIDLGAITGGATSNINDSSNGYFSTTYVTSNYTHGTNDDCYLFTLGDKYEFATLANKMVDCIDSDDYDIEKMFGDDLDATMAEAAKHMEVADNNDYKQTLDADGNYVENAEGANLHAELILYDDNGLQYIAIVINKKSPKFRYSYKTREYTNGDNGGEVTFGANCYINGSIVGTPIDATAAPEFICPKSGLKARATSVSANLKDYNDYHGKYNDFYTDDSEIDKNVGKDDAEAGGNNPA